VENWRTARQQILRIEPDLLLVGGDMTRDGNLHAYELQAIKADLDSLPFPYAAVPGNVDTNNKHTQVQGALNDRDDVSLNVTSENIAHYHSAFGPVWWSFVHKEVRFSGFCDMLVNSGLPEEEELWKWMDEQKRQPRAKRHVWVTHYPLFMDDLHEADFDITDPVGYYSWYFNIDEPGRSRVAQVLKATGTDLVVSGHVHCRKRSVAEGIRFDIGPSAAFSQQANRWKDGDPTRGFVRYDVTDEGIGYTFVPLEKMSKATGYGPGGHPLEHQRDYSIAWEK
jgi:3',5'-cyclic AMP phosphodiesterase CpdA